ncbi:PREDICTED: C2 domain-containing protein 2 isoform X2 [Thamnophis sirtalis]|uniref:C2 domain-containing protein 2 isoform X2 n=1 Tax=Thamnophis sirtalis TaxID=35019 RepID=A0A6I9Y8S1_9SAUR|nr:PREDICTED: C2 domain-containing protein 2 isoform X2 [Thamnophis sirtalis]
MSWLACWLDELQRFSLLSLFTAALAILTVYLVQYGLSVLRQGGGKPPPRPSRPGLLQEDEGGSLFTWLMSLDSWKSEWQKAWIAALNKEAGLRENTCLFTFDEDAAHQNQELGVEGVRSVVKSAEEKVVSCNVIGNSFHFLVSVYQIARLTGECQSYRVKLSPLHLQLKLSAKSEEEDIQIKWSFIYSSETNIEVKPTNVQKDQTLGTCTVLETFKSVLQNLISCTSPVMILSTRSTDIKGIQNTGAIPQGASPPKPPRAHELKLLMKNIKATLTSHNIAGIINPICIVQLNDPLQKFCSSFANYPMDLSWKKEFIFELNAKSTELQISITENGELDGDSSVSANVPLDLFRKQPSGLQSFALNSQIRNNSSAVGSVSAEFLYIEPSETKSLQVPAKLPVAKVEKDRTVMPCGTVVTTVTAVKAKTAVEGRSSVLHSVSPVQSPAKLKGIEKDLSIQAIHCQNVSVSKALSSSDTELLVLSGTDPVAEVAIQQLSESAKQKFKSPRKKSTIIISGISKTNLSQDSKTALMMDYAAAMDGSCKQDDTFSFEGCLAQSPSDEKVSLAASQTISALEEPQEHSHGAWTLDDSHHQWHNNALLDQDCDKISGSSVSISESEIVKKSKGGILKKSAKLFFLRRHHKKDPGMSQSHNDLSYLQQPRSDGTQKKGGTLTRILNKKTIFKSKTKLNGSSVGPHA